MNETAYAKVNLALHVRGREPDGYHRIETAFAFAQDGDTLSVADGPRVGLEVTGPFAGDLANEEGNIVLDAALALQKYCGIEAGAFLTLDKRLPVASGIGGGSADAAAALRLLARWWRLAVSDDELLVLAKRLGADVAACFFSRSARGEGRGDRLEFKDYGLRGTHLLLVNPRVKLSTRSVFERWDGRDGGPLGDPWAGRNDLEAPARRLVPEIGEVLDALAAAGMARMVRMSGSGATCFALFDSKGDRDGASRLIAERKPLWWRLSTCLR
ncbi:MAG TPA: 4-(cytidine 5'-diphospho)-2-C-methyl-D-erythritol kinase [Allosphingosinicella sp.]|jgi:4-diphosphocytidyl-2-C-methyl-D-erythritol kinase